MWETIFGAATVSGTLSRLAEELILFSSYEYRTVSLDDGFAMGSSMMPQKKNPGSVELIRGRAGRMTGYLTAAFTMMKGLPSGYNRDFHEDKELLVSSMDLINNMVEVIPPLINSTTLNLKRMHELTYGNFATATEIANYLVLRHNVPFRQAHHVVGSLVGQLSRAGQNFSNTEACFEHLDKEGIKAPREDILKLLDPKHVMLSYNSQGGTGAVATGNMIKDFKAQSVQQRAELAVDTARVNNALIRARKIAQAASSVKTTADLAKIVQQHF
jgi:argininosuccinate lyase